MKQYFSKVVDAKKSMPKSADIASKIDYFSLQAYKQDVSDWSDARQFALDPIVPDWTDYIRVLDDVMVDAHVSGIIRAIKKKVKSKDWYIYNADGSVDEDLSKIFRGRWFKKMIDLIVEADFYPYSVIQLGDYDDGFDQLKEIKREYYTPQHNQVKRSLYVSTGEHDKYSFDLEKLKDYFIVVKSEEELGLLDHVAPHALGKKHMLIYWWRYGEQYGLPFRIGKTDVDDNTRRAKLENAFTKMGNNMWMVTDLEDQVDLLSDSNKGGSVDVFLEAMKYSNNEISKNLAGAVGVFDEKSFVGSSEAGERLLDTFVASYCNDIQDTVQHELIPRIINVYNDTRFNSKYFGFDYTENISYEEQLKGIDVLSKYYDLDPEQIEQKTGFKIKPKQSKSEQINDMYNGIKRRY